MSRTTHSYRNTEFPAKTKRKFKDRKDFGYTSGTHSEFKEPVWVGDADRDQYLTEISTYASTGVVREATQKTYPIKGVDFIKYGYGRGVKKENRVKNYQKEIE